MLALRKSISINIMPYVDRWLKNIYFTYKLKFVFVRASVVSYVTFCHCFCHCLFLSLLFSSLRGLCFMIITFPEETSFKC